MFFVLLFWFAVWGSVVALIASSRSQPSIGVWFFVGGLLGPIGLILVLVAGDGFKCPACKHGVPKGATKCGRCQSNLSPAMYETVTPPTDAQKKEAEQAALRAKLNEFRASRGGAK